MMTARSGSYHSDILTNDLCLKYLNVRENYKKGNYVYTTDNSLSFIRFVYIFVGNVFIHCGNEQVFMAQAHDMVYFPYGINYSSHWHGQPDSHYIVIDISLYDHDNNILNFGDTPSILFHDSRHGYPGLFSEITRKGESQDPFFTLECVSMVFKLCYEMASYHSSFSDNVKFKDILNGVFYLENNCLEDISIAELAQMCMMSETNFRKLFYQYKGISPLAYKNQLRVREASKLLMTGKYSVTEVSKMVRCSDVKHFSKLFKHFTGCSPKEVIPNK